MKTELLRMKELRIGADSARQNEPTILVDGVDVVLSRGEILGLIGESGAGKTSIGLAALAYFRPGCRMLGGVLTILGNEIGGMTPQHRRELRGRRVAYVAQSAAASFNPAKTIISQVCELPIRHGLMNRSQAHSRAIELFRELGLPKPETFGSRYPHQVSGGQLQRAMAAMAMVCEPDVLVLDEPTTALDVTTQIEVLAAIRKLIREHGTAGLYISHDLAVIAQVANRIMVLRNGRVVETGKADEILSCPKREYTKRLVAARKTVLRSSSEPLPQSDSFLLRVHGVSAAYSGVKALCNASLDIRRAETVAVVGESGSGKSTLARVICGLMPPTSGTIEFRGNNLPPAYRSRSRDMLRRIQLIYQMPDVALNPRQTIEQIIGRPLAFYSRSGNNLERRIDELLALVELPSDFRKRFPHQLSGGQKQRVCIARALAAEPDVIVCDEITSSLDQLVAEGILRSLEGLRTKLGLSYLFITHDLSTVMRLAHRVVVMREGSVVAHGLIDEVFSPPTLPYTTQLMLSVPEMRTDWLDGVLDRRSSEKIPI